MEVWGRERICKQLEEENGETDEPTTGRRPRAGWRRRGLDLMTAGEQEAGGERRDRKAEEE